MEAIQLLWQSRLRRDTLLLIALQIVYRLSGVVCLAVRSRCLPAGDIGAYVFALSFAESFTLIANFRLNPILMRRVAADPGRASTPFGLSSGEQSAVSPLRQCDCDSMHRCDMVDRGTRRLLYSAGKLLLVPPSMRSMSP